MNYRKDQEPIMAYTEGTMAVGAVPGAGKTFIVANLVAKLIEDKRHKPGKILIVTYMNSAVNNFKSRIGNILKEKNIGSKNDFEVMTIHSLAYKILCQKPDVVGLNEDFEIIDESTKRFFMAQALNKYLEEADNNFLRSCLKNSSNSTQLRKWTDEFSNIALNAIGNLKLLDKSSDAFTKKVENNPDKLMKSIAYMYKQYDKSLKIHGYIDYDDILNMAYKIIKNDEEIRKIFQKKYSYIFEDECQDSNLIQCKLLKILSKDNDNLVRVGDMNQSITGTFSSSEPKLFKEFMGEASKSFLMDRASRSSKDVIDMANYLVDYVINNHSTRECREALVNQQLQLVEKGPWGCNPITEKYSVFFSESATHYDELSKVVEAVKKFKNAQKNKSIGILVPYNSQVDHVCKLLESENIEFEKLSGMCDEKFRVINLSISVLNFISNPNNINNLIGILKIIGVEQAESLSSMKMYEALEEIDVEIKGKITRLLNLKDISYENILMNMIPIFNIREEEVSLIESVMSYIKVFTRMNKNTTLSEISKNLGENKRVFSNIVDVVWDICAYEPSSDKVSVSTYHKSKGLEWDFVILCDMSRYNFPSSLRDNIRSEYEYLVGTYSNPSALIKKHIEELYTGNKIKNEAIEAKIKIINEKVRLIYVGITRAKEYLMLTSSRSKNGREQKVSEYFTELRKFSKERS